MLILSMPDAIYFFCRIRGCRGGVFYLRLGDYRLAEVLIAETDRVSKITIYNNIGEDPASVTIETLNLLACESYRYSVTFYICVGLMLSGYLLANRTSFSGDQMSATVRQVVGSLKSTNLNRSPVLATRCH